MTNSFVRRLKSKNGMSIIEVLCAVTVLAFVGLSMTVSTVLAQRAQSLMRIKQAATRLAQSKVEELSGVNPTLLSDSYDSSESSLTDPNINSTVQFARTTDVTVNADSSKTIVVTVSTSNVTLEDDDADGHNDLTKELGEAVSDDLLEITTTTNIPNWAG